MFTIKLLEKRCHEFSGSQYAVDIKKFRQKTFKYKLELMFEYRKENRKCQILETKGNNFCTT